MHSSSNGASAAPAQSWDLRLADRLVGTLTLEAQDMFWSDCHFRPGPAWEDLRPLIARSEEAWRRRDLEAARAADEAIMTAGLVLLPHDDGAPITGFLLRVDGESARFRY